MNRKFKSIYLK